MDPETLITPAQRLRKSAEDAMRNAAMWRAQISDAEANIRRWQALVDAAEADAQTCAEAADLLDKQIGASNG